MNLASVPDSFGLDINNDQTLSISVPTESRFALSFKDTVGIWSQPIVETFKHIIRKTTTATTLENNHPQSFAKPSEGKWVAFVQILLFSPVFSHAAPGFLAYFVVGGL